MKLLKFRVENYRCIKDSGWVTLDDVAVIVGKNESGKTSLLKALAKFRPFKEEPYNLDREWPRGRRKERSLDQRVVTAYFEFNEEELNALKDIDESCACLRGVEIEKTYKGTFTHRFLPQDPDQAHKITWVVSLLRDRLEKLEGFSPHFASQYRPQLDSLVHEVEEHGSDHAIKRLATFKGQIVGWVSPNAPETQQDNASLPNLNTLIDEVVQELTKRPPYRRASDLAQEWLPVFIYMDDYETFQGRTLINQLHDRRSQNTLKPEDRTVLTIMSLAGLDLKRLVEQGGRDDREQRMLDLNDASLTLTSEIAQRWSQKRYEVRFELDGNDFRTFVKDLNAPALVPLEERSRGFQWFFSFDMKFMHETHGEFKNAILLLDEPGLHLHAAAQRDLLKRLQAYACTNQMVYTTHMPFMIDLTRFDNLYIAEERGEGVIITDDWANANQDARFTLQAALGLSWSQSLFIGHYNLVVEGVTDFWLLSAMSEVFAAAGSAHLDADLVITPAGGASKVAYVSTILTAQDLKVAVLLDSDAAGDDAANHLLKNWILKQDGILRLGEITALDQATEIEDLFEETYYLNAVQSAFRKELGSATLTVAPGTGSVVVRIEQALRKALPELKNFNKGRAAKVILEELRGTDYSQLHQATRERFTKLFERLAVLMTKWRAEQAKNSP